MGSSAGGHEFDPGVSEERQATLVSWWRKRTQFYEATNKELNEIILNLKDLSYIEKIEPTINQIKNQYSRLSTENDFISSSLDRYQKGFNNYTLRQRIRWFVFDGGIPLLLGVLAIVRIIYLLCI